MGKAEPQREKIKSTMDIISKLKSKPAKQSVSAPLFDDVLAMSKKERQEREAQKALEAEKQTQIKAQEKLAEKQKAAEQTQRVTKKIEPPKQNYGRGRSI